MVCVTKKLTEQKLIAPEAFVHENLAYETLMGSQSYGVSSNDSDWDIYGFCVPDKELVFPHLKGDILGFGRQIQRFEQFQQHGLREQHVVALLAKYGLSGRISTFEIKAEMKKRGLL